LKENTRRRENPETYGNEEKQRHDVCKNVGRGEAALMPKKRGGEGGCGLGRAVDSFFFGLVADPAPHLPTGFVLKLAIPTPSRYRITILDWPESGIV
jgi:hypothetical protein